MPSNGLNSGDISDAELSRSAAELAYKTRVFTLSTGSSFGCWSAPVYYLYRDNSFYFFSSKDSRHIREAQEQETLCAASLFQDSEEVRKLKGLQMQGRVEPVGMGLDALVAAEIYVKKFNIRINGENTLAALIKLYRAKFYRFVPEEAYYMDNSLGFGTRKRVQI